MRHAMMLGLALLGACGDLARPTESARRVSRSPDTTRTAQPADTSAGQPAPSQPAPSQPATVEGRIAFVGNDTITHTGGHVFVMNADGSNIVQLTHDTIFYMRPVWSPDGSKLAFAGIIPVWEGWDVDLGVFVIDADGSGLHNVAPQGSDAAWSPDGSKVRFAKRVDSVHVEIHDVTPDGSTSTLVATLTLGDEGAVPSPRGWSRLAWAPDLGTFALNWTTMSDPLRDLTQLYVVSVDGRGFRRLTSSPDAEGAAAWAPDGQRIAIWSCTSGVAVIDPGGIAPATTVYQDNCTNEGFPGLGVWTTLSWSPDGNYIAFVNNHCEIWIRDVAARMQPWPVTPAGVRAWDPAWSR